MQTFSHEAFNPRSFGKTNLKMELSKSTLAYANLLVVDDLLYVLTSACGNSNYDFRFDLFFPCRHQIAVDLQRSAIARIGAIPQYDLVYQELERENLPLIHTYEEHLLASELPHWYPRIADLTPESHWCSKPLKWNEASSQFGVPFFMKGTRQTSRHQKSLSIINDSEEYEQSLIAYANDPILRHQDLVYRRYERLRLVEDALPHRIPSSFEFRTFWWKGDLAGCGQYWWEGKSYRMTPSESTAALSIAKETARRLNVPFLVVDIAQTIGQKWIVIECNDGQESGYGGIAPIGLWQRILDIERSRLSGESEP
jgi:hypothetical protein